MSRSKKNYNEDFKEMDTLKYLGYIFRNITLINLITKQS